MQQRSKTSNSPKIDLEQVIAAGDALADWAWHSDICQSLVGKLLVDCNCGYREVTLAWEKARHGI